MSNLIKAGFVSFQPTEKRVIDSDSRIDLFRPVSFQKQQAGKEQEEVSHDFVAGIPSVTLDKLREEEEKLEQKALVILADAQDQARVLLDNTKIQAEIEKKDVFDKAKQQGYYEGYQTGSEALEEEKRRLELEQIQCRKDYENRIAEIEPSVAKLLADYVGKITGIIMEDHEEVIFHLVHKAMTGAPGSTSYTVKVSLGDYAYVSSRKNELMDSFKNGVQIDIIKDESLAQNECLIETDTRTMDCSLKVQLENLITDIKLLGNI